MENENNENNEKTEDVNLLEEGNRLAERLEFANQKKEELIAREEALINEIKINRTMSGLTNAGEVPEKPKEESPEEYVDKVMSGILN